MKKLKKKQSFFQLLCFVYRISYIVLSCHKSYDFERWDIVKTRLNSLLNHRILWWLSGQSNIEIDSQILIDYISEIILSHYRNRQNIYKLTYNFPVLNRFSFILLSFIYSFAGTFAFVLRNLCKSGYRYSITNNLKTEKINLSIGFPANAFSIESNINHKGISSFGEFLYTDTSLLNNNLISFGEYSKNVTIKNKLSDREVSSYPRYIVNNNYSALLFISRFFKIFLKYFFSKRYFKNREILFSIIYFGKWVDQFNFDNFIGDIGISYNRIDKIFILPFSDVGLLKYDLKHDLQDKVTTYMYSQNSYCLPSPEISSHILNKRGAIKYKEMLFAISYLPLFDYFLLHGNAVGFTGVFDYTKKLKVAFNKYLNTNFHISNVKQSKEKPLALGYDVINRQVKSIEKYVAIFDMPPRTLDGSMTHNYSSLMGSRIETIEVVEEYLLDCIKVSIELGFNIALKPKYFLHNPFFHDSYKKLFEKIQSQYRDRVIIMDPYTKMDSIANLTVGSISMPYTSTKYFFENSGKESIFYLPIRYESVFRKNYAVNITFGTKNLESFLLNL